MNETTLPLPELDADPSEQSSSNSSQSSTLQGSLAGNSGSSVAEALYGLAGGALYGMISPAVGHPFDCVKTRMQADKAYQGTNFSQTVTRMYRTEGLRSFYRGFVPPLVSSIAFRGFFFSAYAGAYSACEKVPVLAAPIPYTGGLRPSVLVGAIAATVARAVVESPFDFIKVRYMVGKRVQDAPASPTNLSASLRHFSTSPVQNVRHLYHGFTPTLFRTMGCGIAFFVMVDYSVRYLPDVVNAPLMGPFFKGGVCATAALVFAFPFESTKSLIQADTTGKYKQMSGAMWKVMLQVYQDRGVRGLYRGFGPAAIRSVVANGTSMMVYTWFSEAIRKRSSAS